MIRVSLNVGFGLFLLACAVLAVWAASGSAR